jgi:hypothetical protein
LAVLGRARVGSVLALGRLSVISIHHHHNPGPGAWSLLTHDPEWVQSDPSQDAVGRALLPKAIQGAKSSEHCEPGRHLENLVRHKIEISFLRALAEF